MTAEERIKNLIGELNFQIAFLLTQIEAQKKELDELKQKDKIDAA